MSPTYREVDVQTILRGGGIVDSWFLGRFGMNLYRGCEHGCAYCDGRAERYYVEGRFESDIVVKRNAVALLRQELAKATEPGFIFVGGGVSDAWQPAEQRWLLARGALEEVLRCGLSVHLLTKSSLVERDFDLLAKIRAAGAGVIVSMSVQTLDETVRERFEPGASPIEDRWRVLERARQEGFGVGVMAIPLLPGISDQPEAIQAMAARAARSRVDFLEFGGLTLRPGAQRDAYLDSIRRYYPALCSGYERVYGRRLPSGAPDPRYQQRLAERIRQALADHNLAGRIPRRLFRGKVPVYTEVAVLLEQAAWAQLPAGGTGLHESAKAGVAIQRWARSRLKRHARTRGFSWRTVEEEFLSALEDGSLAALPDVGDRAAGEARRLISDSEAEGRAMLR